MKNLVIGNTSQISRYFNKDDSVFISSRETNIQKYKVQLWNNVYLCFGESKKYIENINIYDQINFELTKEFINTFKDCANKIYVFSTCELWNKYSGPIDFSYPLSHWDTPYLISKRKITEYIVENQKNNKLLNVILLFPFNFNSIHRNQEFLFGKIYNSLLNKQKIEIGNTYFYRDIISPQFLIKEIYQTENHRMLGSGRLIFVNDYIRDLYKSFNMNYEDYVVENLEQYKEYSLTNEYYFKTNNCLCSYSKLLNDTVLELKEYNKL